MKTIIIVAALLFASTASAEQYSWIKGGIGFGNFDACLPGKCLENGEIETSRDFFIQISPLSIRGPISKDFGIRLEPFGGYSERDLRYEGPVVFDGEVKEFQLGGNLFIDYRITPEWTIYAGPTAGMEFSQIEGDIEGMGPNIRVNTDPMFNFFPGAEAGVEWHKGKIGLGAFWRWTNPDSYQDRNYQVKYDVDRGHSVGGALRIYWD